MRFHIELTLAWDVWEKFDYKINFSCRQSPKIATYVQPTRRFNDPIQWSIPSPARPKHNRGLEPPWCAVIEELRDGFWFQSSATRSSVRKPACGRNAHLTIRPGSMHVVGKKIHQYNNEFCGHSGSYVRPLPSAPNGRLVNRSEEVYSKTNRQFFFPIREALSACTWLELRNIAFNRTKHGRMAVRPPFAPITFY